MSEITPIIALPQAASWMVNRGWKLKLAKKQVHEQSLFEHTLTELEVLLQVLPIVARPQHYNLSEEEQRILAVAVLAHDVGKETDDWQSYIRRPGTGHWVSHVIPELTRAVVPELSAALGLEALGEPVQRIMAHCAEFHHNRPGQSDGAVFEAMLSGGSYRFLTLAHLVRSIDHFCSAAGAAEAVNAMRNDPALGHHLRVASHEVVVRGVSTTFLHHSAQTVFQQRGWKTLLYFPNATVYAADPNDSPVEPTAEEISGFLRAEIETAIARDVTSLMVGDPRHNFLPKPDLFSFSESRQYLVRAGQKSNPRSFMTTYDREKSGGRRTGRGKTKAAVIMDYWKLIGKDAEEYSSEMDLDAGRLSAAQPEMLVFKFFKAMMDPEKIPAVSQNGVMRAQKLYEATFGLGSWEALRSTSTTMPAHDMAKTIDYFWALPGMTVGHPEVATVAELQEKTRIHVLIDALDQIAQEVYKSIEHPSPRDQLSQSMAIAFIRDLVKPVDGRDIQVLAQDQLAHYAQSKPFAGRESKKGIYFCPICNTPFDCNNGVKASADFVANPQTHTNRGVAYGRFEYVMICTACYYERLLLQILLGESPAEIITLSPRLNLGPAQGGELVRKVRQWVETAQAQMRGETGNLEVGFSLGFTDQISRKLGERDAFMLQPEELLPLFSYHFNENTQKDRRKEATRRLKEEFDNDLEVLNVACNKSFNSWEAAVEDLVEGRIIQQEFRAIRRDVFRLFETIHLICQTPNLVFIPLNYEVAAGDESEASKGLRRLYVALLLSMVFDASIAIHKPNEPVDFSGAEGAAYVPPVPAIKSLIPLDWIPIPDAKRWLSAIGAASRLVRPTGYVTKTGGPTPAALYQILVADPAEMLARRVEQEGEMNLTLEHLYLIAQLPRFRTAKHKEAIYENSDRGSD